VSLLVRRSLVNVGTCSASSNYSRDVFEEDGSLSVCVRRSGLIVGTFSAKSD